MSKYSSEESLRRLYRNWQRKRNRILPTEVPLPFCYAKDIDAVKEYFSGITDEQANSLPGFSDGLHGHCFLCDEDVLFRIDRPGDGSVVNWRETLACPHCELINRWRSCLHVFEAICEPTADDRIYLTETLSPIYKNLEGRFPLLKSSEYFPDKAFGEVIQTHVMPVRNEDVTKLSFDDSSVDIVLSFDVLEHVPDYRAAVREFYRVLDAGGQLVISVPFSDKYETLVRATVDDEGNIKHLVEPCYHGDPLSSEGVLSFYDFGMELLDEMREAGFQECFLLCYYSKKWAYLNPNVVFIARKLKTDDQKGKVATLVWQSARNQARFISEKSAEISRFTISLMQKSVIRMSDRLSSVRVLASQPLDSAMTVNKEVLELPGIFHYWSNKYLAPEMSRFGFGDPEDLFFQKTKELLRKSGNQRIKILSIGSGDCEFEIRITKKLLQWQLSNFVFECLDVNKDCLDKGKRGADAAGLAGYFLFTQSDLNHWRPHRKYEIVFANQSLHDVRKLEGLFNSVKRALKPDGLFIISDMIGKNGGACWPEALDALQSFWDELPPSYRYNRVLNRQEEEFIRPRGPGDGDKANRSQDILPLLSERFNFKFFFPYGNLVFVFIDRSFGHNFDASADWDKDFVDRVHARDEAGMINGEFKPVSMLAVLTNREVETVLRHPALTPEQCVREVSALDPPAGKLKRVLTGKG